MRSSDFTAVVLDPAASGHVDTVASAVHACR